MAHVVARLGEARQLARHAVPGRENIYEPGCPGPLGSGEGEAEQRVADARDEQVVRRVVDLNPAARAPVQDRVERRPALGVRQVEPAAVYVHLDWERGR